MTASSTPRRLTTFLLTIASGLALAAGSASAATIKVGTTHDEFGTGDKCSLREAIQAANTDAAFGGCKKGQGTDEIELRGGKRYVRELPGAGSEDANASGDFDVASKIKIEVGGKGKAELNAGGLDRVLEVRPGATLKASDLNLRDGDVYAPQLSTSGGGILNYGVLKLRNSVIQHNEVRVMGCDCGGAVSTQQGSTTTLERVKVLKNETGNIGAGIGFLGGKLEVLDSTIAGNKADYSGGGVYLGASEDTDSASIRNSTLTRNESHNASGNAGGGAIFVSDFTDAKLSVVNSTLAGNESDNAGGAIWLYSGDISVKSSTITDNTAQASGTGVVGGGGVAGSSVQVVDSIVAGNHATSAGSADCLLSSVSSSLVGKDTGCSQQGNRVSSKPGLKPLGDNGGPTETVALKKSSPAVNHGSKSQPGKDQRGRKRDKKPDLGAYELIKKKR